MNKLMTVTTPLYLACQKGHYDTVQLLLDKINQRSDNRADINIRDSNGGNILHVACFKGHTNIVRFLIDLGMNVNEQYNDGFTPLYLAWSRRPL